MFNNTAIALGSNLGDSHKILSEAIDAIAQTPGIRVVSMSSLYDTKPVGPPQPNYLNGCLRLQVEMIPELLLEVLLKIENNFGRLRNERWGARTLDLDILLYSNRIIETPKLQIPHPRMRERAFVLVPLAEIAPDWIEPVSGLTIKELLKDVNCCGVNKIN